MENVMLNSIQTQIKIVDFGLSNVWSADSPLRTHCGSPEYAAPELFVTGKEYGAEVDLWSLGIILYGMVVGQLPFVSTKNDHVSSQERRKRLVSRINKGLACQHRRAIACFSTEFRNMMNKLLIADTAKRITIKELIVHPWITEKGKKTIRSNPIRQLDAHWQAKIVSEIGTLLEANVNVVMAAIAEEPFGKVGGMYNILSNKHTLNLLNGDGITKTNMPLEKNSIRRENVNLNYNFEKLRQSKKICPSSAHSERAHYSHPPPLTLDKLSNRNQAFHREEQNKTKNLSAKTNIVSSLVRPATTNNNNNVDYRSIKSPILRRKAYSATLTAKVNHTITEKKRTKNTNRGNSGTRRNVCRTALASAEDKSNTTQILSPRLSAKAPPPGVLIYPNRSKTASAKVMEKSLYKSEVVSGGIKRPVTVPETQTAERLLKRCSIFPVNPKLNQNILRPTAAKLNIHSKKETLGPSEKSPRASGDGIARLYTKTPVIEPMMNIKKSFMYDPIARSIAGYVVNNIPDKLHNLTWFRK